MRVQLLPRVTSQSPGINLRCSKRSLISAWRMGLINIPLQPKLEEVTHSEYDF